MPGDAYKLYEMAYHAGDIILEIGTYCGKSAVIALRGALANPKRARPQWYGIDNSKKSILWTEDTLRKSKLAKKLEFNFTYSLSVLSSLLAKRKPKVPVIEAM